MNSLVKNGLRFFTDPRGASADLPIVIKLSSAIGALILSVAGTSYLGLAHASAMKAAQRSLFEHDLAGISAIKEAGIYEAKSSRLLRDAALANGKKQAVEDLRGTFTDMQGSVQDYVDTAAKAFVLPAAKQKLAEIKQASPKFSQLASKVFDSASAGHASASDPSFDQAASACNDLSLSIAEASRLEEEQASASIETSSRAAAGSPVFIIAIATGSILLAALISFSIIRSINRSIKRVMNVLEFAAVGNFSKQVESRSQDEFGRMGTALNNALARTRNALQAVSGSAATLTLSAQQVLRSADDLAANTREQSEKIQSTASTVEEITATAKGNANHANLASELAGASSDSAKRGGEAAGLAVNAMQDLNEAAGQISSIATAMDEIAFQTKLLSLNAAIEAARAGEQGRAFAVVANEVRSLADKSSGSARGIRNLIQNATSKIESGSLLVTQSGNTLNEVVHSVERVNNVVDEISHASREQSTGIEDLSRSIVHIESMTERTRAQSSALSNTARELNSQAADLHSLVGRFVI